MGIAFSITMLAVIFVLEFVLFAALFPKDWTKRKIFYGIRNRKEYEEPSVKEQIDAVCAEHRRQVPRVILASLVIMGLLLLMCNLPFQLFVWLLLLYVTIVFIFLPYAKCNRELKNLKRRLGFVRDGIIYTDLATIGSVHALKLSVLLLPNAIALADFLFFCLSGMTMQVSSLGGIITTGIFLGIGFFMIPIAISMDRQKNEIISEDSAVNQNYNRAKKKTFADTCYYMLWVNTVFMLLHTVLLFTGFKATIYFLVVIIYTAAIITVPFIQLLREKKIDERYLPESTVTEEDDDLWIFGLFYYNPKDRRININKRNGMGSTINLGHPVGKGLTALLAALLLFSLLSGVWVGLIEITPLQIKTGNGKIVCRQLKDDYVIDLADIRKLQLVKDLEERNVIRESGVDIPVLSKGRYSVDKEGNCRFFLNPKAGSCIRIETDDIIYYISLDTAEKTEALYQEIYDEVQIGE